MHPLLGPLESLQRGIYPQVAGALIPSQRRLPRAAGKGAAVGEAAAVGTLAMSGDALTGEAAAGETVASELGELGRNR